MASFLTPVKHASVAALKKCDLGKENGKCFQNNRAHTSSLSQRIWRWNKSENSHAFLSLRLLLFLLHWTTFPFFFSFFCSFLLRFPGSVGVERKDGGGGRTADGENLEKIVLAFFAKLTSLLTQTGFKDVKHWYSSLKLVWVCWKKFIIISGCYLSWENKNLQNYFLHKKELIIFHFNNRCFFIQINFSACVRTSNTAVEQQNKRSIGLQVLEKINLSHHLVVCPELFAFKYVLQ